MLSSWLRRGDFTVVLGRIRLTVYIGVVGLLFSSHPPDIFLWYLFM